ncbi:hypothetical protein Tco_0350067, partial [Tanacetum coccineum]
MAAAMELMVKMWCSCGGDDDVGVRWMVASAAMKGKVGMMLSGSIVGVVLWWDGDGGGR